MIFETIIESVSGLFKPEEKEQRLTMEEMFEAQQKQLDAAFDQLAHDLKNERIRQQNLLNLSQQRVREQHRKLST